MRKSCESSKMKVVQESIPAKKLLICSSWRWKDFWALEQRGLGCPEPAQQNLNRFCSVLLNHLFSRTTRSPKWSLISIWNMLIWLQHQDTAARYPQGLYKIPTQSLSHHYLDKVHRESPGSSNLSVVHLCHLVLLCLSSQPRLAHCTDLPWSPPLSTGQMDTGLQGTATACCLRGGTVLKLPSKKIIYQEEEMHFCFVLFI